MPPYDAMVASFLSIDHRYTWISALVGITLCCGALPVMADTLDDARQQRSQLEQKIESTAQNLDSIRDQLTRLAREQRQAERDRQMLRQRLDHLVAEEKRLVAKLAARRDALSALATVALRATNLPPMMAVFKYDTVVDAARGDRLMRLSLPALEQERQSLSLTLLDLRDVRAELDRDQQRLAATKARLASRTKELQTLMAQREKTLRARQKDLASAESKVRSLLKRHTDLDGLVTGLLPDMQTAHENNASASSSAKAPEPKAKPSLFARLRRTLKKGEFMPPVLGTLSHQFGDPLRHDQKRTGITYVAPADSIIVAPMDGVVRFAGPFKHYGQLVILEHSGGFHSMVAGMSQITTPLGSKIRAGEPLGIASANETSGTREAKVYFELRQNGQPLDPKPYLRDTG